MIGSHQRRKGRGGFSAIEVAVGGLLLGAAILLFGALYPISLLNSEMSGQYTQATGIVQHKADQMRLLGYGRLTYDELQTAGIIDASANASPYHFTQVDALSSVLVNPSGTISVEPVVRDLVRVTVRLEWDSGPNQSRRRVHEVAFLVSNL